jgi:hypothetical protein
MSEIRTAFFFTVTITVAPAQIVGATPIGERRNVPVTGGTFGASGWAAGRLGLDRRPPRWRLATRCQAATADR